MTDLPKDIRRAIGEIVFSEVAETRADCVITLLREAATMLEAQRDRADAYYDKEISELYKLTPEEKAAVDSVVDALTAAPAPPAPRKRGRKPRAAAANGTAAPESPAPSRPADDPPLPLEV